uniref:Uncharacterized protein n=1 Tax=Setaria italica TaxID=4555 RepID=K3YF96_SETIT
MGRIIIIVTSMVYHHANSIALLNNKSRERN